MKFPTSSQVKEWNAQDSSIFAGGSENARLQVLKDWVEEYKYELVGKNVFDLNFWEVECERAKGITKVDELESYQCGTTCCLLGWAGHIPELRAQGLLTVRGNVWYANSRNGAAAEEFFKISDSTSNFLFWPSAYQEGEIYEIVLDRVIHRLKLVLGEKV